MACVLHAVEVVGIDGHASTLAVEVAANPFRRARGMMGRQSWGKADGMLFVYPWPRRTGIWMAGTALPIDAAFIDRAGRVVRVARGMLPFSRQVEHSGVPVKWVLEVPAGRCDAIGLDVGCRVLPPASTSVLAGVLAWLGGARQSGGGTP